MGQKKFPKWVAVLMGVIAGIAAIAAIAGFVVANFVL